MLRCKKHGRGRYSVLFDTYYCADCDRWLEKKCENARFCELCQARPKKPSMGRKGG
ncbi:hypothetical protein [Nitrososphaera sp.]|uniref:hypothetical protein n=1 Tax=Nitrososphaera sp. TaxID=1971748 RepID=UPI00307D55EF